MSSEDQTTSNMTSPTLCKMGCGFFGSNATGDCCSKCYKDLMAREGNNANNNNASAAAAPAEHASPAAPAPVAAPMEASAPPSVPAPAESSPVAAVPAASAEPAPMEVDEAAGPKEMEVEKKEEDVAAPAVEEKKVEAAADAPAVPAPEKKKKKKKAGYKNLMAGIVSGADSPNRGDADKAKEEQIRKVTGGGAFSKIDKI